ncbi:MAG: FAD-dependent oxidoreductase [Sedimentisphaerales bacterium]|nr:FAD-dependent oxidoreductase [Sedimentisphaerales bacterium]
MLYGAPDGDGVYSKIINVYIIVNKRPDVLIVGGGVSGLAAAVSAAGIGCQVLLIEKELQLGGMFCKGLGFPICGLFGMEDGPPKNTLNSGLAAEFYHHICEKQNNPLMRLGRVWICKYSPNEAVQFFESKIDKAGHIYSLKNSVLHSIEIENERIKVVQLLLRGALVSIRPKVVIECSGNGALLACCPDFSLLPDNKAKSLACVLIKLDQIETDDTMLPVRVPYILRKASQEGIVPLSLGFTTYMPLEKPGQGVLKLSVLPDISLAEQNAFFEKIVNTVLDLLQQEIPSLARARIIEKSSGLLQRVGLRGHGQYILNKDDVLNARKFDGNGIKCAWPIEYWDPEKGPQYHYLDKGEFFEIPLTCLMSKSIKNLFFSGRCISATEQAISAARVMGTCISLGEAAGILAANKDYE